MYLVVDCGTTFLKAALADSNGCVRTAPVRIRINSEIPSTWVQALEDTIGVLDPSASLIDCIMVTGCGPCAVPVFADGSSPLAVTWDSAGQKAASPSFIPRILALRDRHPDIWEKAHAILGTPEYLSFVLTGVACTCMPAEGYEHFYWDEQSLEENGIPSGLLPPFTAPGQLLGKWRGIPVLAPCPDYMPAIIGSGAVHPGMLCLRTGTGDGINLCCAERIERRGFLTSRHPDGVHWNLSRIVPDTGLAVMKAVGDRPWDEAFSDKAVLEVAKSAFRRTAEAVFELKDIGINEIRLSGGMSDNEVMNSLRAEALGMRLSSLEGEETGLQGLAILAFCAVTGQDIVEAADRLVKVKYEVV